MNLQGLSLCLDSGPAWTTFNQEIYRCKSWIEMSLDRSQFEGIETHNFGDVRKMLLDNEAQLWSTEKGCVVTFISHFPQSSLLTVWLCGGDFEQIMTEREDAINKFGKDQGCSIIYILGRKGWKRKLKARGYVEHATVVSRKI